MTIVSSPTIFSMILLLFGSQSLHGFTSPTVAPRKSRHSTEVGMAPRYDPFTKRWEPTTADEEASAGYPAIGSLIRQGPVPFLQRLKDPDMYDQAVLKMMANSDMDRNEAQGNLDAYLLNPNDWALQKFEEKRGAPKFDYANANMEDESLILTGTWAGILLIFAGRIAYVNAFGCDEFCRQTHF